MADLDRIRGPSGPPPSGPKKEKEVDGQKFREVMDKKKLKAPEETDSEQQGKRKRRERAEAEQQAEMGEAMATPPQAPPKGGEPSAEGEFKVKETGAGAGVSKAGVGAAGAPEAAPSEAEEAQPEEPDEAHPLTYTYETRPKEKEKEAPPAEAQKPTPAKKGEVVPHVVTKHATPKGKAAPAKAHAEPAIHKDKAKVLPAHRKAEEPKAPRIEEKREESPLPQGAWESTRAIEKKKEKETEIETAAISGVAPTPVMPEIALTASGPLPPYTTLPSPMPQLFDRMVGGMNVLYYGSSTETTITLNAKDFENSVFYGSQIVITEYPTARKEYNIKVLAPTGKALDLLNNKENMEKIMTSFSMGNLPYKVRRFETGMLTEETRPKKRVTRAKKTKEE